MSAKDDAGDVGGEGPEPVFEPEIIVEENVFSDFVLSVARRKPGGMMVSFFVLVLCTTTELLFALRLVPLAIPSDITDYTEVQLDHGDANFFKMWREEGSPGAGKQKFLESMTVSQWACSGSSYTWWGDKVNDMSSYGETSPFGCSEGIFFGTLCIFIWIATVLKELRASLNFGCLMTLPSTTPGEADYQYSREEKVGRLVSLSLPAKGAVALCVVLRLSVNIALLIYGCQFLAHSQSLQDFVLNSVALGFIYELDELFFEVLVSSDKQKVVRSLERPLVHHALARRVMLASRPFVEIGGIILCAAVLIPVVAGYLEPFAKTYVKDVLQVVCTDGSVGSGGKNPKDYD